MEKKRKIRCQVKNCFNSTVNGSAQEYFRFPKDNELQILWAQALGVLPQARALRDKVVCSDHFLKKDIAVHDSRYILKEGAVPYPHTRCSAYGCFNFNDDGSPFKFWSFPTSQTISEKWKLFTQGNNFVPSRSSTLCSAHFSLHQYNGNHLKIDAVPDIPIFTDIEHNDTIEDLNSIELVSEVPSNHEVSAAVSCAESDDAELEHLETAIEDVKSIKLDPEVFTSEYQVSEINGAESVTSDDAAFDHLDTIEDVKSTELDSEAISSLYEVSGIYNYGAESVISDDAEFDHLDTIEDVKMQVDPFNSDDIAMRNRRKFETIASKERLVNINLRRKIRMLQQKVRRQDRRIRTMKDVISVLKKEAKSQNKLLDAVMSDLEEFPSEFVLPNKKNKKASQEDND